MTLSLRRTLLMFLAFVAIYVGGWAYFAPKHWYENFPGFGLKWLPQLGPYNMHLAKDDGALYLALAALSLIAIRYIDNTPVGLAAASSWLVVNVLHFVFHMQHLYVYDTSDKVLNVVLLGFMVVCAAALFVPVRRVTDDESQVPHDS